MRKTIADSSDRPDQALSELSYLKQIRDTPLLSTEEEKTLGWAIINNKCSLSRQQMVTSNLRLVIAIAKLFRGRGLPLLELVAEGNIGLLRAVDGFDPSHGTRFSTYACWWIKQAIRRALFNAAQSVHVPQYMVAHVVRWKQTIRMLELLLCREPSRDEVAKEMNLPLNKVRRIEYAVQALETTLQEPVNDDGDFVSFGASLTDDRAAAPFNHVLRTELLQNIHRFLAALDERERLVLLLRFGLQGRQPLTLSQIAREIGISRERVRQIADEALGRIGARVRDDGRGSLAEARLLKKTTPCRAEKEDMSRRSLSGKTRAARRDRPRRTPSIDLVMPSTPLLLQEA